MKNKNFYKGSFLLALLLSSLFIAAQNTTTVKATVDKPKIFIGEQINLKLEADIPENQPIHFFGIDSLPHFEILNKGKIDTSNTNKGTVLAQTILITSFDSGHWVIPAFVFSDKLVTDTLPVDVGYSSFDPAQPYHDIKDIIEVTPAEEKKKEWWVVCCGRRSFIITNLICCFQEKEKTGCSAGKTYG
ncbi:MAG: hypothetical protein WDN26_21735 [Chitinophagaceae bacterium]